MMRTKILAFCGSSRRHSLNQNLLDCAAAGALEAGAEVTKVRLLDFELPIYGGDGESEHGVPKGARELQELVATHQGLLIASPEHNGGYTALLKNAIDWVSRPRGAASPGPALLAGRLAALVSASPGNLGGIRSQMALQFVLNTCGVQVIPESFALGTAQPAFDRQGCLKDPDVDKLVRDVGAALVRSTTAFLIGARTITDLQASGATVEV